MEFSPARHFSDAEAYLLAQWQTVPRSGQEEGSRISLASTPRALETRQDDSNEARVYLVSSTTGGYEGASARDWKQERGFKCKNSNSDLATWCSHLRFRCANL